MKPGLIAPKNDQKQEWSFDEDYIDWRKRNDWRTGSTGIGGCWP
jgi:hypothetical protein